MQKDLHSAATPEPARASGATPAATVPSTPLSDPAVVALAARSPTLTRDLAALRHEGIRVEWGASGGGTFYDESQSRIVIDVAAAGNASSVVRSLSHEIGHVQFKEPAKFETREAYVHHNLRNEGAATLHNATVRNEIIAQGGADIGISGANVTTYGRIASQAAAGTITRDQALDQIAAVFGQEHPSVAPNGTYIDYYGGHYDTAIVPWLRGTGQRPEPTTAAIELQSGHPAAPLFSALRSQFPTTVSDTHTLDATLKAHAEGITHRDAKGVVHEDRAWVMSTQTPGLRAYADLTVSPQMLGEAIQRDGRIEATQLAQPQLSDIRSAEQAPHRPSL